MASFNELQAKHEHEFSACSHCTQNQRVLTRFSNVRTSSPSREREELNIQRTFSTSSLNSDIHFDQNDIAQVSLDRIEKHTVEFLSNSNLSTDKSRTSICNNCDEGHEQPAVQWCEKCECYLCEYCSTKIHSNKAFQSHTTISSAEKLLSFCTYHSRKMLKYWCKKCKILVCDSCLDEEHKSHLHSSLKDAAIEARMKFQETVQEMSQIRRNLTTFSETTKDLIQQQRELVRQGKIQIEQTFNYLQCRIEDRKCAMLKQLDDQTCQTTTILERKKNVIQQLLNLAVVNEDCIQKMLHSNDLIQVLKLKSTLHQNFDDFIELYNRIDDGYLIKRYVFKKDDKDIGNITSMILKVGHFNSTSWMIQGDSVTVQTTSIDISRVVGNTEHLTRENGCARGYKLTLKKPLKLRSIQIHSDHAGSITGFVVNHIGTVIQKSTTYSSSRTMKWLSIPIECDLQTNYSVLIVTTSDNGSYTYKNGDNQVRILNQNFSVESVYVHSLTHINVNSIVNIENHPFSLDMVLCIEE